MLLAFALGSDENATYPDSGYDLETGWSCSCRSPDAWLRLFGRVLFTLFQQLIEFRRFFVPGQARRLGARLGCVVLQKHWTVKGRDEKGCLESTKKRHLSKSTVDHTAFFYWLTSTKYERILLLARRILVVRIHIFKYNVFWLGVFSVLSKTLVYFGVIMTKYDFNTYLHIRNCIHMPNTVYLWKYARI